jgi:hypothetical protein
MKNLKFPFAAAVLAASVFTPAIAAVGAPGPLEPIEGSQIQIGAGLPSQTGAAVFSVDAKGRATGGAPGDLLVQQGSNVSVATFLIPTMSSFTASINALAGSECGRKGVADNGTILKWKVGSIIPVLVGTQTTGAGAAGSYYLQAATLTCENTGTPWVLGS